MSNNDIIGEVLDLNPLHTSNNEAAIERALVVRPEEIEDEEVDRDLVYVRKNMYDLIEKGHRAVENLEAIADQSQHPRAFEVLSTLIKTISDANKDLLDVHEKKKKLIEKEVHKNTVNNNLFVGSTSDLLKLMNKDE